MSTNTLRLIMGGGLVLVLAFALGCRYPAIRADQPIPLGGRYHKRIFQDPVDQQIQNILLELASLESKLLVDNPQALQEIDFIYTSYRATVAIDSLSRIDEKPGLDRIGRHIASILRSETKAHVYEIYLLKKLKEVQYSVPFIEWGPNSRGVRMLMAKAEATKSSPMEQTLKSEYLTLVANILLWSALISEEEVLNEILEFLGSDYQGKLDESSLDRFLEHVRKYISP